MKITAFFLIIFSLHVRATGFAQGIFLSERNVSAQKVFREISKQTGYTFLFNDQDLETIGNITIEVYGASLEETLKKCLFGQPLEYRINGKTVVIRRKNIGSTGRSYALPDMRIRLIGHIINEINEPLEAVTIIVAGTSKQAISDKNGEFMLEDIKTDAILLFSRIGYQTHEIRLNGQLEITVKLKVKTTELKEIEVTVQTGYQDIAKERATGSFDKIDNELYNRKVGSTVLDRIYDVSSGLSFSQNRPTVGFNSASSIQIRGVSTINANNAPLIVVDDFPYDGDINTLNPNDVSSVTILKDAAAASIWGVRAGNGVIVITTKKGKNNQKVKVSLNSNITVGEKPNITYFATIPSTDIVDLHIKQFQRGDFADAEFLSLIGSPVLVIPPVAEILIARRDERITNNDSLTQIDALRERDVRNDISKHFLQEQILQQYALSLTGGSDKYNYYTSIGYDRSRSGRVGDDNNRLTIRFDNTIRPISFIALNGYIIYAQSRDRSNGINLGLPNGSTLLAPYSQLMQLDGNSAAIDVSGIRKAFTDTATFPGLRSWQYKPIDELKAMHNESRKTDIRIGGNMNLRLLPFLTADIKFQYQSESGNYERIYDQNSYYTRNLINQYAYFDNASNNVVYPVPLGAILDASNSSFKSLNMRGQINFNKKLRNYEFSAIGGVEQRETSTDMLTSRYYGYNTEVNTSQPVDYLSQYVTFPSGNAVSIPYAQNKGGIVNRYRSLYTNAAYTYKGKYTISGSGRIDGSNFFGIRANQREIPLWSLGVSYLISKEKFYQAAWLPFLKLRATYGYNGNTTNAASAYGTITFANNNITRATSALLQNPPNPELRWERIRMLNVGVDYSLIGGAIEGSLEYYHKSGIDLISDIKVDPTTGVSSFIGNNANIVGQGVDIIINSMNLNGKFLKWQTNLLFSFNTNKVTNYDLKPSTKNDYLYNTVPVVGKTLYNLYAYQWAGLDPSSGEARVYLSDTVSNYNTADISAKTNDLTFMGSTLPRYFGSIRNSFSWNHLSVSVNITYKFGYVFRRNTLNYEMLFNNWGGHADYFLRWQKPGDEATTSVPVMPSVLEAGAVNRVYGYSNHLVEKGDHIRLQDIRISYDLDGILKKSFFQSARIYAYANNIGIIWRSNMYDIDPEFIGLTSIPSPKTIAIGVNLNF